MSILGDVFAGGDKPTDAELNFNAIALASGAANAYLASAMASATPELRRLFSEYMNQHLVEQGTLASLAVAKGWDDIYQTPENHLATAYQNSQSLVVVPS